MFAEVWFRFMEFEAREDACNVVAHCKLFMKLVHQVVFLAIMFN